MNINLTSTSGPKRNIGGIASMIFFIIFGSIFAGAGFLVLQMSQIDESWSKTTGKVTDIATSRDSDGTIYRGVFEYEVEGTRHKITDSVGTSFAPTMGSTKEVAYNPANPSEAKVVVDGLWMLFPFAFIIPGIVLVCMGPIFYIKARKRAATVAQLKQTGHKVQGIITDIQDVGNSRSSSYQIVVSATDTSGAIQTYTSDTLMGSGGIATANFRAKPIPIDVYISPTNPKSYYVDVDSIPDLTPEALTDMIKSATGGQATPAPAPITAEVAPAVTPAAPTPPIPPLPPQLPKI